MEFVKRLWAHLIARTTVPIVTRIITWLERKIR